MGRKLVVLLGSFCSVIWIELVYLSKSRTNSAGVWLPRDHSIEFKFLLTSSSNTANSPKWPLFKPTLCNGLPSDRSSVKTESIAFLSDKERLLQSAKWCLGACVVPIPCQIILSLQSVNGIRIKNSRMLSIDFQMFIIRTGWSSWRQ